MSENEKSNPPGGYINDPALYRRLSEPVDSVETAAHRGQEFYQEVCKLREMYHIPDLVMAWGINAKDKDGKEKFVVASGFRGSFKVNRLIMELVAGTRVGQTMLDLVSEVAAATLID